jgi:nitrate reductase NapAB chaperone NapD
MQLLDNDNRWAYNGTRTYPPCEGPVLWTIPMIVLPIKEEHYSQIQKQLQRSNDKGVKEFGNAREVQESDEENKFTIIYHEPTFMLMQGVGFFMILAIVFLVLCMVYLICCLVFFCKSRKLQKITTNQLQMTTMSDVGGGKAGLA